MTKTNKIISNISIILAFLGIINLLTYGYISRMTGYEYKVGYIAFIITGIIFGQQGLNLNYETAQAIASVVNIILNVSILLLFVAWYIKKKNKSSTS